MARSSGITFRMTLEGAVPLIQRLKLIKKRGLKRQIWKKMLRTAGNLIIKLMRRRLRQMKRVRYGYLQKAIIKKILYYKKSSVITMLVGVRSKWEPRPKVKPSKYAHLIEWGRKNYPGRRGFPGINFIEHGLESAKPAIYQAMAKTMEKHLSQLQPV